MEVTTVFSLLGGLGLFLFGIKTMGDGLEQAAGSKMKRLLEALTRNKFTAVLVGLLVTAVIQSSSATTVMVVGFVNAGLLSLSKAIGVIMGANIVGASNIGYTSTPERKSREGWRFAKQIRPDLD